MPYVEGTVTTAWKAWMTRGPEPVTLVRKSLGADGSAPGPPGLPVEQFACDLKVAGVRGRLLDYVQDDPADTRDLGGVLRVRVEVEPARGCRKRSNGENLIGLPAHVAVVGDDVGARPVAREGGVRIVLFFIPFFPACRRVLGAARGHLGEPVVLGAAEVSEHSGHRPAGRHDRRLPGLLGKPLDDLQHRVALTLQEGQEQARLVVLGYLAHRARGRQWSGLRVRHRCRLPGWCAALLTTAAAPGTHRGIGAGQVFDSRLRGTTAQCGGWRSGTRRITS